MHATSIDLSSSSWVSSVLLGMESPLAFQLSIIKRLDVEEGGQFTDEAPKKLLDLWIYINRRGGRFWISDNLGVRERRSLGLLLGLGSGLCLWTNGFSWKSLGGFGGDGLLWWAGISRFGCLWATAIGGAVGSLAMDASGLCIFLALDGARGRGMGSSAEGAGPRSMAIICRVCKVEAA